MTLQKLVGALALLLLIGTGSSARLTAISGGTSIPSLHLSPGGDFQWLVRLEGEQGRCSGSLIAAEWVLTAGHCVTASLAFVGDDSVGVQIVDSALHPQFEPGSPTDVALLRLAVPSAVLPIRRAGVDLGITVGQELTLAGWGRAATSGAIAEIPSSAAATVIGVDPTFIHTGAPGVGCAGDSGGPVVFEGFLAGVIVASDAECQAFTGIVRFSNIGAWVASMAGSDSGNLPPTAVSGELTVSAGQVFEIALEFDDAETPLSLANVTSFEFGALNFIGCRVEIPFVCRFAAPADRRGDQFFTYSVSDGEHTTEARWVIHVIVVNVAPFAEDGGFSAVPGVPRVLALSAGDDNGDRLIFEIVTPPLHGVLSNCATGGCTYTAHGGYAGPDRFTWRASDGQLVSNVATASIDVQPAQAPVVKAGAASAVAGIPSELILEAFDPNGDRLEYSLLTEPRHGTITFCSDGFCEYVADSGFLGTDSFTWFASDGGLDSAPATFTIEVLPHHPPFALDDETRGRVNSVQRFELSSRDPEGAGVTLTLLTLPRHGTLTCAALVCEYRPQLDYVGPDSFTWRTSDGELSSRIATATLQTHASSWRVTPLDVAGDVHALAVNIAGPGAIVSNAVLTGAASAAGSFAGAADAIGLAGGVILSTGRVADAIGPNLAVFTSTDHHLAGDADLPAPSADAAALSFDMVPSASTFTLRYVFASEEYPFAVGFVDEAAAIIVNGRNCAVVGSQRVGTDSINHGNDELGLPASNRAMLIANDTLGAVDIELNALTVVLTCTATLVPGVPNHIKIVIADNFDGERDSVLFLEGTAAVNTPPTIAPLENIARTATDANGVNVTFAASGNDAEDGALAGECLPASGTAFPIGDTTVTCVVRDNSGATAAGAFTVTVTEPETPGHMSGEGFVRDGATRYQFSFDARENDRGERAKFSLRINPESPKGKGKDRDDRFESRTVTFTAFSDDPDVRHRPRRPQIDTVLFSGIGEWNGKPGFRYEVAAQDEAEAGRRHRESIRVTVWNAANEVVASFSGEVGGGAIRSKRLKH